MFHLLSLALVTMSGSAVTSPDAVARAQRKCVEAAKGPAPNPMARLPVEKFDECIAAEANKWPMKMRKAVCALGKSGGAFRSPVEVYMANGKCRTDYE
uniref:hypothetical protein n=1 Tax=Sphingomonas bacterium TaxID=1895847 RepID=UPI002626F4DC|nr:hypothetical protein [Sphingomonas bacterium]